MQRNTWQNHFWTFFSYHIIMTTGGVMSGMTKLMRGGYVREGTFSINTAGNIARPFPLTVFSALRSVHTNVSQHSSQSKQVNWTTRLPPTFVHYLASAFANVCGERCVQSQVLTERTAVLDWFPVSNLKLIVWAEFKSNLENHSLDYLPRKFITLFIEQYTT